MVSTRETSHLERSALNCDGTAVPPDAVRRCMRDIFVTPLTCQTEMWPYWLLLLMPWSPPPSTLLQTPAGARRHSSNASWKATVPMIALLAGTAVLLPAVLAPRLLPPWPWHASSDQLPPRPSLWSAQELLRVVKHHGAVCPTVLHTVPLRLSPTHVQLLLSTEPAGLLVHVRMLASHASTQSKRFKV